jgi:hypothetical protein
VSRQPASPASAQDLTRFLMHYGPSAKLVFHPATDVMSGIAVLRGSTQGLERE